MGFLRRDRIKYIFFADANQEPVISFSNISYTKRGWILVKDNDKITLINPDFVSCIIEELTEKDKKI